MYRHTNGTINPMIQGSIARHAVMPKSPFSPSPPMKITITINATINAVHSTHKMVQARLIIPTPSFR
jgi:hypothetical protein